MQYEGTIIRPPSEAHSIILQVTVGCSHNQCTFCGAYRDKKFRIKSDTEIREDISFAADYCRRQRTVFLADGDALAIPHKRLIFIFGNIKKHLPWVRRISLYANCKDILRTKENELSELKGLGLGRIYMGLESGDDPTLTLIKKGSSSEEMISAAHMVKRAGIFLSVTSLLGIGGAQRSQKHAEATGSVLSKMEPDQIAVLTLMILDNTPLAEQLKSDLFTLPDKLSLLQELRKIIEHINVKKAQFQANHASNYLALNGRLPRDKSDFLSLVDQALVGTTSLKPESLRSL